jgi:hypothetical protein
VKNRRAGERKFFAAPHKTTIRNLSTAGAKIFSKIMLEKFRRLDDKGIRNQHAL